MSDHTVKFAGLMYYTVEIALCKLFIIFESLDEIRGLDYSKEFLTAWLLMCFDKLVLRIVTVSTPSHSLSMFLVLYMLQLSPLLYILLPYLF